MFKDVLNHMDGASHYAAVGLVIFFIVFLLVTANAFVRSRRDIADWSRLPLGDDEAVPARSAAPLPSAAEVRS